VLGPFLVQDMCMAIAGLLHARAKKAVAACLDRSGRPRPRSACGAHSRAGHRAPADRGGAAALHSSAVAGPFGLHCDDEQRRGARPAR
jgi:hypothetical protein